MNAQFYVGYRFNNYFQNQQLLTINEIYHYPFEETIGYKFDKIPYNLNFSLNQWILEKEKNDGYYRPFIPQEVERIEFFSCPIEVSKRFYLNDSVFSLYFNTGLIFSMTYGYDDLKNNYFTYGPGFDLSVTGEFSVFMASVGTRETFELFGRGMRGSYETIYFSVYYVIDKTLFNRRVLHKPF